MMQQGGKMDYLRGENFQSVRLPYGDEFLSMAVFLPDEGVSLEQFRMKLSSEVWAGWQTHVEVNEEGTEAAAVTSIAIGAAMAKPVEEPFSLIVDRPFFVAIQDNQTGAILFSGLIVEPN